MWPIPNLWKYVSGILGIALLALSLYAVFLSTARSLAASQRDLARAELKTFVEQTKAAGVAAAAENKRLEAAYAENIREARRVAGAYLERVRDAERTRGGGAPNFAGTPEGSSGTGKICFDAADFNRAMERGRAIAARGDQAIADTIEWDAGWPE